MIGSSALAARHALVIGNDDYKHVSPLKNARADAKVMAEQLEKSGFKVKLALNQKQGDFKKAIRTFKNQLAGGDEVVFFYAGHGVQIGGANYLLPIDMSGEDEDQVKDDAISLQRVLDDFLEQKTRFALAIVDACRDNPFKGRGRNLGTRGLAPTSAADGQMVIFSAGTGQQALDRLGDNDRSPNGLFTRVFVEEMKKPGVPVHQALRNVRGQVVRLAKSVGHQQTPAIYDQAVGEFIFTPGNSDSTGALATPVPSALQPPSSPPPPLPIAIAPMSRPMTSQTDVALSTLADRFLDNNDGTITDHKTRLVWQRCSLGQRWSGNSCTGAAKALKWDDAYKEATAGGASWRLPTKDELKELVHCGGSTLTPLQDNTTCPQSISRTAIAETIFPETQPGKYWTSSPVAAGSRNTWLVNFRDGATEYDFKHNALFVRLVRNSAP